MLNFNKKSLFKTHYLRLKKSLRALVPYCHSAFTLAETLIVIGIIGVVAALTLPNLNHATGDKEKVTRVKKIYSALTDAVDRAQVIYGPCEEWVNGIEDDRKAISERIAKRISEFMKVSKDCGFDKGCFSSAPRIGYDNDQSTSDFLTYLQGQNAYMVSLSDGTSLAFFKNAAVIDIIVDIDGPNKGKNQNGNDLFAFEIFVESQDEPLKNMVTFDSLDIPDTYTQFSGWVVKNGNLDYLKADYNGDDEEWTCRETGKILDGVTNTSCQ